MTTYNRYKPGRFNNYLIAGNLCNAFAIGKVGDENDFFLVGAEPEYETNYPLLTGNILDSKGQLLCRIARNALVYNPGNCTKTFSDRVGYEIFDKDKNLIFKMQTRLEKGLNRFNKNEQMLIATISGNLYDKSGRMAFKANNGETDEQIEADVKSAYGFSDGFGLVNDITGTELEFVTFVMATRGRVHLLITGKVEGQEFPLDGRAFIDADVRNSTIHISTGEFIMKDSNLHKNTFVFHDQAENMRQLMMLLDNKEEKTDRPATLN